MARKNELDAKLYPAVVMHGNLTEGFDVHGPFPTFEEATGWLQEDPDLDCDTWVMTMHPPKGEKPSDHPVWRNVVKPHLEDDGRLYGVVEVDVNDLINGNMDTILDLLSEKLTGSESLSDITFSVVGFKPPGTLYIEVGGDPALILEHSADLQEEWKKMEERLAAKEKSQGKHQRKRVKRSKKKIS